MLDIDNFQHVYNFVRRSVERNGDDVQTVLFTVYSVGNGNTQQEEIDEALDVLEQIIHSSPRRADVSTRYSSKQIIVILMGADRENGDMVARRIIDNFDRNNTNGHVEIGYDIAQMKGKNPA